MYHVFKILSFLDLILHKTQFLSKNRIQMTRSDENQLEHNSSIQ